MPHSTNFPVQHVSIIGCGSIGASWAALFLAQGLTVTAFDINAAAEASLRKLVSNALPVLKSLGLQKSPFASVESIVFTTNLGDALQHADFVQENGPERLELKQKMFEEMASLVRRDVILATSSSGLTCSSIQAGMSVSSNPERVVVGHPFNPPHLIPLVEVVGGQQTSDDTIQRTMAFYNTMGKKAVHVKKEVVGHIANRLQAALMREMLYMLQSDTCSISDIDDAMAYGPGLRWGIMGPNMLFHLAGGEQGAQHMADHLLEPVTTWWAQEDPVLDDALKRKWVQSTMDAVGDRKFDDLVTQRDSELVRLLNLRKEWDTYAEKENKRPLE
ncbi:3-hydroxyacyl-CoA dehydrogenase [Boeremia exigua]|uniref:3-hydroxyacyl-CoA dehydrogenase n=1 Tax=Boeremia exigua TaxID=749465 RepID=UPI001E8EEB63|nr:3-hydroxyacyl-CoA dehydrogenase [Boeremia exigua]KAH6614820.1 3-hydroxyacyl-CoA dehydrogenase [Boeremia exigua]